MRIRISAIENSITERRKSSETTMVLLLLSLVILFEFQSVHSFSHFAVSISPKKPLSTKCLSTLGIRSRRNISGDGDNSIDIINNKTVNSNTATVPGYTFFQRSGRRVGDSQTKEKLGYVPSGMSREEYSAIRKKEVDREKKMNYGAWGPRFFRIDRPDGDWMVMPNLWTFGQVDNASQPFNNGVDGESNGIRCSIHRHIQSLVEAHGPAFLLGYVLVDYLLFGYALWKFKQIQDSAVLKKAGGLAYAMCRLLLSAIGIIAGLPPSLQLAKAPMRKTIGSVILGSGAVALVRINALKSAAAVLQIPLWNRLMDLINRRWLWSKKRCVTTITSTLIAGLTIFGIVLFR